jgi:hypothetical protein
LNQIQECWDSNFQTIHGTVNVVLLDGFEQTTIGGQVFKDTRYEELCLLGIIIDEEGKN